MFYGCFDDQLNTLSEPVESLVDIMGMREFMDIGSYVIIKPRKDRHYRQALVTMNNQSKHVLRSYSYRFQNTKNLPYLKRLY